MSVKITGVKNLISSLESKFGPAQMRQIEDEALKAGAKVFKKELIAQFETFKVDGYSIDEMTLTDPYSLNGVRTITVKWKGPHKRYTIIHLNEFGTIKNPSPRGKGAIARALQISQTAYRNALRDKIKAMM
ncbi:hypothetical protein [Sporosarcina sp. A2]|uniref:hypothetical protein n=1 Tax=Sporosarcina sp. A2 TaxID=3393449 RepID=UPI003D7A672A